MSNDREIRIPVTDLCCRFAAFDKDGKQIDYDYINYEGIHKTDKYGHLEHIDYMRERGLVLVVRFKDDEIQNVEEK